MRTRLPLLLLATLACLPGLALADTAARPHSLPCRDITTAFGETFKKTDPIQQRYTFAGREASGHASAGAPMFYRNRMYAPTLGRFGRRDPKLGGDWLHNAYGLPGTNGVGYIDPFGLEKRLYVYVTQPGKGGHRLLYIVQEGGEPDVGHTFVALVDIDDKTKEVKEYVICGFYPADPTQVRPKEKVFKGKGEVRDDELRILIAKWNVRKAFVLKDQEYAAAKEYVEATKKDPPEFNLLTFNCTDWAREVAKKAGQELPSGKRKVGEAEISNPTDMGEELVVQGGERRPAIDKIVKPAIVEERIPLPGVRIPAPEIREEPEEIRDIPLEPGVSRPITPEIQVPPGLLTPPGQPGSRERKREQPRPSAPVTPEEEKRATPPAPAELVAPETVGVGQR